MVRMVLEEVDSNNDRVIRETDNQELNRVEKRRVTCRTGRKEEH